MSVRAVSVFLSVCVLVCLCVWLSGCLYVCQSLCASLSVFYDLVLTGECIDGCFKGETQVLLSVSLSVCVCTYLYISMYIRMKNTRGIELQNFETHSGGAIHIHKLILRWIN